MKSIILAFFLLAASSTICFAQCDKNVILTSSKSEHLDGKGAIEGTMEEKTTVEMTKTDITVNIVNDNGTQKMTGTIKSKTCDWKVPFKEGKMVITTTLTGDNGDSKDFTVTIEGNNGKLTLTAETPAMPDRKIRLELDTFEEKK